MTEPEFPGRRVDIIGALQVLATITPATLQRWPGLTEAVHWLIDDTGWDLYREHGDEVFNPASSVGTVLRADNEVAAINDVLDPLLVVLDELGPVRPDLEYLNHRRWPDVAAAARGAHKLLASHED